MILVVPEVFRLHVMHLLQDDHRINNQEYGNAKLHHDQTFAQSIITAGEGKPCFQYAHDLCAR
jgi:hypothetical protein